LSHAAVTSRRKTPFRNLLFVASLNTLSLRLPICAGVAFLTMSASVRSQTTVEPGKFGVKYSGFENLVTGEASQGQGAAAGGSTESEIEITPQYKTTAGTVFAARGVLNFLADSTVSGSSSTYRLTVPELSFFAIGKFGRLEVGDRAGFPQSLIGFTPSEIAFTSAEFGPDSGTRLDPNGRLPTAFLPHPLADRINNLTYLGYAERFYDDRSLKLIYLTPRSTAGFYGAVSYAPSTDISNGFELARGSHTPNTDLEDADNQGVFRNIVQAAAVWDHRTDTIDLSTGITYSYAAGSSGTPLDPTPVRDSNSISGGITATFHDSLTLGLSASYDGFSTQRNPVGTPSPVSPYGVVASANYTDGPWAFGGYYQHATSDAATAQASRDTVDIGEMGISYLIDNRHDLLGANYYTDVRLFGSIYYYRLQGAQNQGMASVDSDQNGEVFLVGARFAFF
jgi:hypothetical protein